MNFGLYLRLIVLTAGTLLPLFWMVVILGHRRQRNFERIFFFLCLAVCFFFGSALLELNAQLYYLTPPAAVEIISWIMSCIGLWFFPSLLVHLHVEYAEIRQSLGRRGKRVWLIAAYAPTVLFLPDLYTALQVRARFDFVAPSRLLGMPFRLWLTAALLLGVWWQWRFRKAAPDAEQARFHRDVAANLVLVAVLVTALHVLGPGAGTVTIGTVVGVFALSPLVTLIRKVQRFNFLQIGRQQNLIYAVFATFLALLYLSLVRRASTWVEAYLPPEATAAILLFLPIAFFEPLQRLMRRLLRATAQTEMDRAQKLMGPILEVARLGSQSNLQRFIERWVAEQLQLAEVKVLLDARQAILLKRRATGGAEEVFAIRQTGREIGTLKVKTHGAMLSGETIAALQFLCEQLPGSIDLCRLIEEKLQLERELAERERLALVGQTAASISHNLKNPLGSIKTILQVQLENPDLPESMRGETRMVLEEIGRLSAKLNQLLQFSRPAIRGGSASSLCDARQIIEQAGAVLRAQAEHRGIVLTVNVQGIATPVAISAEALNDVASNLLVNALEAAPRGGHVTVAGELRDGLFVMAVEDDGPGIPEAAREKILQPFFTTKSHGTGLGLAIVARRVSESGGRLDWKSPAGKGCGTRFQVSLPLEREVRK